MASRDDLVRQLRGLAGCANLTFADLGELRSPTKQRIFLGLLAELPEGKEAVMACSQLQMECNRTRQEKVRGAMPEVVRRSENHMRTTFYREVGDVLAAMGVAPGLRDPKKLQADASICLRAIGLLAARVGSIRHRQGSAFEFERSHRARRHAAAPTPGTTMSMARLYRRRRRLSAPSSTPVCEQETRGVESVATAGGKKTVAKDERTGRRWHSIQDSSLSTSATAITAQKSSDFFYDRRPEISKDYTQRETALDFMGESRKQERPAGEMASNSSKDGNSIYGRGLHSTTSAGSQKDEKPGRGARSMAASAQEETPHLCNEQHANGACRLDDGCDRGKFDEASKGVANNTKPLVPSVNEPKSSNRGRRSPGAAAGQPLNTVGARVVLGDNGVKASSRNSNERDKSYDTTTITMSSSDLSVPTVRRGTALSGAQRGDGERLSDANGHDLASNSSQHPVNSFVRGGNIDYEVAGDGGTDGVASPPRHRGPRQHPLESRVGPRAATSRGRGKLGGLRQREKGSDVGGGGDDGDRVFFEEAVGLEMGTLEAGSLERAVATARLNKTGQHKRAVTEKQNCSLSSTEVDALWAENARLKQRVEELQELVGTTTATSTDTRRRAGRQATPPASARAAVGRTFGAREGVESKSCVRGPSAGISTAGAAASEAILRGQAAQLRRQVRLQWCAVDASAAVTQAVKAVLHHLEATLFEICSLGKTRDETTPAPACGGGACGGRKTTERTSGFTGGVGSAAAIPAWRQLLGRVQKLSRELQWAERAAQRAADGRLHVTKESGSYLRPCGPSSNRGQRRPRDLRLRALDPSHFTCPAPAHGSAHQQLPGAAPAAGYSAVIDETSAPFSIRDNTSERSGDNNRDEHMIKLKGKALESSRSKAFSPGVAKNSSSMSSTMYTSRAGPSAAPGMHELYHLDAASVESFGHTASAALSALGSLLSQTAGGNDGHSSCRPAAASLLPPGVASLLLRPDAIGSDYSSGKAIVESVAEVRDRFLALVTASAALGVVVPSSPEGAGAASADTTSPSLRLLRGVKPAGGGDSARRLEALARRLPLERAALEAAAAASASEARAWRAAAKEQASAILALGQGLRDAWGSHIRRTSSLSRPLTAVLGSLRQLLSSPEHAPILRGAAGAGAAALLQTLALFEPELEEATAGISSHARLCEEEVSRLSHAFEEACWHGGVMKFGQVADKGAIHGGAVVGDLHEEGTMKGMHHNAGLKSSIIHDGKGEGGEGADGMIGPHGDAEQERKEKRGDSRPSWVD